MAWVRYDDTFPINPKVTGVIVDEVEALSLHLLGNTWTNAQKRPGFIPAHQPAMLVCDREKGARWAATLVRYGLWHERGQECERCTVEYADLPADLAGFVVHDLPDYRAPARDRTTAGTPADLSEKRRAAGRKGGRISADRRKQDEAKQDQAKQAKQASASTGQANAEANGKQTSRRVPAPRQANEADTLWPDATETSPPAESPHGAEQNAGSSKPSNLLLAGVSPVPVPGTTSASNEAEAAAEEPTPTQRAFGVARDWIKHREKQKTPVVAKSKVDPAIILRKLIQPFIETGYGDNEIKRALDEIGESIPSTAQLDRALTRLRNNQGRRNGQLGSGTHQAYRNPVDQDEYNEWTVRR